MFAGKNCIKEEEEIYQLFVYKINKIEKQKNDNVRKITDSHFTKIAQVDFPNKYRNYSKTFCFMEDEPEKYIIMIN